MSRIKLVFFLTWVIAILFPFIASAETISVKNIGGKRIPLEPDNAIWDGVPSIKISLDKQELIEPFGGGSIKKLQVHAVHNDSFIAFRIEWKDATSNMESLNKFSDAVAVQFPVNGSSETSPFMGDEDNLVNIWQWRADWQQDIQSPWGYQITKGANPGVVSNYTTQDKVDYVAEAVGNPAANRHKRSSVADLIAKGFGTLTYNPHQDVAGKGKYKDGIWSVILLRPLQTTGEYDVQFKKGSGSLVAFAVWDGDKDEKDGEKSITESWVNLKIE